MAKSKYLKFYQMNDCDTVIAYSKREAERWYFNETGFNLDEIEADRIKDLSNGLWWSTSFRDLGDRVLRLKEGEYLKVSHWSGDIAFWITFKEILNDPELLKQVDIPSVIRSTEY